MLGLKSMGMELSALTALLRWVPIAYVWIISPSRIVRVGKGIIFTLGLSVESSINLLRYVLVSNICYKLSPVVHFHKPKNAQEK
jgi:hypothetical protein